MEAGPVKSLYDNIAAPFRGATEIYRSIMQSKMLELDIKSVVEIGPGNAPLITCLKDVPNSNKYAIDFPGANNKCMELGFKCLEQDLANEKWDIRDETVDLVTSCMVLEHIANTDHIMQESFRVLRPGGHILLTVPNQGALIYILMLLFTLNPPMNMVSDDYCGLGNPFSKSRFRKSNEFGTAGHGHLRLFSTRAMCDLLQVYGFKVCFRHGATWGIPMIGKWLAGIFPYWGVCTIVLAQKARPQN